ncbi:hypothetical protein ABNQ24_12515 [Ralstonia pseudosolanacearum]|uniref:hypothetical protein n=1 Tax=Ralstonia pseudosolanacearum TaxID=1310165 RepID=UPI00336A0242
MKSLNTTGLHARNEQKRQFAETAILAAVRAADAEGLTPSEIIRSTKISDRTVRERLQALRERELLHVGLWRVKSNQLTPAYVSGPGEDALAKDYQHLRDKDAEGEARKEMELKHAKWARNWRPHRPPEAAWIR